MVSITLSVPEEIRKKMRQFDEINWSGLVRKTIEKKVYELSWKEEMLKQLKEQEKFEPEAIEIGNKIKKSMWKQYQKEGW
jgi:hypothetical protein